jgi:hypothetical protein
VVGSAIFASNNPNNAVLSPGAIFLTSGAASLTITPPAVSLIQTNAVSWESLSGQPTQQPGDPNGPFTVIAATQYGNGRVFVVNDGSSLDDDYLCCSPNTSVVLSGLAWVSAPSIANPPAPAPPVSYYFPHLAFGGGFQTTLTYVNYSPQSVSCQTTFYSDTGAALEAPFGGSSASSRVDILEPGAGIHVQTQAAASAALSTGWAQAQCTGPVKASFLYRLYNGSAAQGEAGVNASTTPTTEFVTFAQTATGIAYANSSSVPATITVRALSSAGATLGNTSFVLQPNAHGAANIGPLLNLSSFTGSVQIISTTPIVSLSLNAEAYPVFSSLPPGDLPAGTPLAGGAGSNGAASVYDFPHLAFGGGFQTTLTYVNYSPQSVSCQTTFYSDAGAALQVPFAAGSASSRTDNLAAGASAHVETQAGAGAALTTGWAQAQCTGPVKASFLYRVYSGSVAQGEAGVNASTTPTTEFVTFAQTATGVAYANPSATAANITISALDSTGAALGSASFVLQANAHGAANIGPLLNLSSFTGSVRITSTAPIVSLSLNAEAYPVFSSLPPGDLPAATPLAMGH